MHIRGSNLDRVLRGSRFFLVISWVTLSLIACDNTHVHLWEKVPPLRNRLDASRPTTYSSYYNKELKAYQACLEDVKNPPLPVSKYPRGSLGYFSDSSQRLLGCGVPPDLFPDPLFPDLPSHSPNDPAPMVISSNQLENIRKWTQLTYLNVCGEFTDPSKCVNPILGALPTTMPLPADSEDYTTDVLDDARLSTLSRRIVLRKAKLEGAQFEPNMDLSGFDLYYTNLRNSFLRNAKFAGSNIFNTNFIRADLTDADFREACFMDTSKTDSQMNTSMNITDGKINCTQINNLSSDSRLKAWNLFKGKQIKCTPPTDDPLVSCQPTWNSTGSDGTLWPCSFWGRTPEEIAFNSEHEINPCLLCNGNDASACNAVVQSSGVIALRALSLTPTPAPDSPGVRILPPAGTFITSQTITLAATGRGVKNIKKIYYTLDESDPENSSTRKLLSPGQSFMINRSQTIKAAPFNDQGTRLPNGTQATLSFWQFQAASGFSHTCASKSGKVWCWGLNRRGQLGNGNNDSTKMPTKPVTLADGSLLTGVRKVDARLAHSCAVLDTGQVRCWGWNGSGQLGNGTKDDSAYPVMVLRSDQTPLTGVSDITTGSEYTCALLFTGQSFCWGDNQFGQLGDGTTEGKIYPVPVLNVDHSPLSDVHAIAAGDHHTCALLTSGQVKCWGRNYAGELGNGTLSSPNSPPTLVTESDGSPLTNIQALSVGSQHGCVLTKTGEVKCWGLSFVVQGQGHSSPNPKLIQDSPTTPGGPFNTLSGVQALASGEFHVCALLTSGQVKCWGTGNWALGDGNVTIVYPTLVQAKAPNPDGTLNLLSNVQAISAGYYHTCVIVSGALQCWGYNYDGALGEGSNTNRLYPTRVFPFHF